MANLRVGYDIFSGSSQAGTDASISGLVQAETATKGLHRMLITRTSDGQFYNATTKAFQAGATAEADDLAFEGSDSDRGIHPAIRRLKARLPKEALAGITAAGATITVYPEGQKGAGAPVEASVDLDYLLVTA